MKTQFKNSNYKHYSSTKYGVKVNLLILIYCREHSFHILLASRNPGLAFKLVFISNKQPRPFPLWLKSEFLNLGTVFI